MFMSKPEHFLIIARPIRPVPITAMVLPVTSSPRNGRNGCHDGHLCSLYPRSTSSAAPLVLVILRRRNRGSEENSPPDRQCAMWQTPGNAFSQSWLEFNQETRNAGTQAGTYRINSTAFAQCGIRDP